MPAPHRDRLGRPVPEGSAASFPTVPERTSIGADDAWREAIAYLDAGLPFHAHEVFEQRWRCAPEEERRGWQALAQWAAALTHEARGNAVGARRIAQRASMSLDEAGAPPNAVAAHIDMVRVRSSLEALSAR